MPSFSTTVVFLLFWVMSTTTTIGDNTDGRKIKHSKKTNGSGSAVGGLSTWGDIGYEYTYVEVKNATPYEMYVTVTESVQKILVVQNWIASGDTWTSTTRARCYVGLIFREKVRCKVYSVEAYVSYRSLPEELLPPYAERIGRGIFCTAYSNDRGAPDSRTFSIIMNGVDKNGVARCSVRDDTPTRPIRPTVPNVQVTNDTPYAVAPGKRNARVWYNTPQLHLDYPSEGIAPGDTWTATSRSSTTRGIYEVGEIFVSLPLPDGRRLTCTTNYDSPGTTDSLFSIIMDGVDRCCVRSSQDDSIPNPYTPTTQDCVGNYVPIRPPSPNVQVKNDTPYAVAQDQAANAWVRYTTSQFAIDYIKEGIAPRDTWTATSSRLTDRGSSKVKRISAYLTLPDDRRLWCTPFDGSGGTTDYLFSIIMDDVDHCSVRSRHSNDPTVPSVLQCSQSKPTCVNYISIEHLGTCVARNL